MTLRTHDLMRVRATRQHLAAAAELLNDTGAARYLRDTIVHALSSSFFVEDGDNRGGPFYEEGRLIPRWRAHALRCIWTHAGAELSRDIDGCQKDHKPCGVCEDCGGCVFIPDIP